MTTKKRAPFLTADKLSLSTITKGVEGTNASFCLAVYIAVRWLANDSGAPNGPIKLSIGQITGRAGCRYNKVAEMLLILKSLGLLVIQPQRITGTHFNGPSVYSFPGGLAPATPHHLIGGACPVIGGAHVADQHSIRPESIKDRKESKSWEQSATPQLGEGPSKPNSPNPILRFLVGLGGGDPAQATKSAWGAAAKARKEILSVFPALTETELSRRVGNYRRHWPQASISASALAKHWAKCDKGPEVEGHRAEPILRKVAL